MDKRRIADIREDYTKDELLESNVLDNPLDQFQKWFEEALAYPVMEPNAMHLSTVSMEGKPSSRIVLLKGLENQGFVFFTNYNSKKGRQLTNNPAAALLFFWPELQRQVRIEGQVDPIASEYSDEYFSSRPIGSQLGAWASPQSEEIPGRDFLEQRVKELENQYLNEVTVPRPAHWGGFILRPQLIEFWQGRANRIHDRLVYRRNSLDTNNWTLSRLAP